MFLRAGLIRRFTRTRIRSAVADGRPTGGATFGSLVHAVLFETADPRAEDLAAN